MPSNPDLKAELRDDSALADRLRGEITEAAAAVGRPDAEVRIFDGMVADALLKASEGADLLVCGSRGWGPVGAAALGSVSNRLAYTAAACPLLAIPPDTRPLVEPSAAAAAGRAT
jgi:nucleotide-binding universal stress UspA family protein